jgi:hypothetical protein
MNTDALNTHIPVSHQLCQRYGAVAAVVHAYMLAQSFSQGDVYTGSLDQLSAELSLSTPLVSESLQRLQEARLLRDITPSKGNLAHAYVMNAEPT